MGKNDQIKYKKNSPYEISYNIETKDLLTENKINVCIYESGLIKAKYKGDFDIQLTEAIFQKDFSQKCKIRLEKKGKDAFSTVVIKSEPQYENINLKKTTNNNNINSKANNKQIETLSKPKIEENLLNNKKEENKVDFIELNKKIYEIYELKNLLNEKEKIITELNSKNQKLKEGLEKMQSLLLEKDKIIEKEKNQNKILINKLKDFQNILKAKEEKSIKKLVIIKIL